MNLIEVPPLETTLRIWWTQTYKIPITDERYGDYYIEDLYQEFMEHMLLSDEELMKKTRARILGYDAPVTGDPLVDLWLKQYAMGEIPNLDLGEAENAKRRDAWVRKKAKEHQEKTGDLLYYPSYQDVITKEWMRTDGTSVDDLIFDEIAPEDSSSGVFSEKEGASLGVEAFDKFVNAVGAIKRQ